MGKYIKKSKEAPVLAKSDMSFGVCTRAKAQALRRPPYLLRSLRLLRSPPNRRKPSNPNPNSNRGHVIACNTGRNGGIGAIINVKLSLASSKSHETPFSTLVKYLNQDGGVTEKTMRRNERMKEEGSRKRRNGSRVGVSFRDNPSFNVKERVLRQSIRDPESKETQGTTEIPTEVRRTRNRRRQVPPLAEMEGFFEDAEKEQIDDFVTKYNFDPVKERPLPGRFEWEKV